MWEGRHYVAGMADYSFVPEDDSLGLVAVDACWNGNETVHCMVQGEHYTSVQMILKDRVVQDMALMNSVPHKTNYSEDSDLAVGDQEVDSQSSYKEVKGKRKGHVKEDVHWSMEDGRVLLVHFSSNLM